MTGIVVGDVVPQLDNPEASATKLGRRWGESIDWDRVADTMEEPTQELAVPLNKAALVAEYGPDAAYKPRWFTGSFRVPYGMREAQFEAFARDMATRWFTEMQKRGFDLASGTDLVCRPGPNPSKDLATGLEVPGYRDYLLDALFVERNPQVTRIELPSELFDADWQPSQRETSGEDDDHAE